MTREEYREQMRALDKEALNVINKKSILRWEYIKSNGGHKIGAKAKITAKNGGFEEYGFLVDYTVDCNGDLHPVFHKMNKDGSVSKKRLWLCSEVTIEYFD